MFLFTTRTLQHGDRGVDVAALRYYLTLFGYIPSALLNPFFGKVAVASARTGTFQTIFDEDLQEAVRLFQKTYKLDVNGRVDEPTRKLINTPRCGFPDIPGKMVRPRSAPVCAWPKR